MGDGIGEAAIKIRQPYRRKPGWDGITIGSVGIEIEGGRAIFLIPFSVNNRNGHFHPVPRGDFDPLGYILARVIAGRDLLHFECLHRRAGDVIFGDRIGRDHRLVRQAQPVHLIFGIFIEAGRIGGFREGDPLWHTACIIMQFDLIEALLTPLHHKEISKGRHAGHVKVCRRRDSAGPVSGLGHARGFQAELGAILIGVDEECPVMFLHIIFHALLARADEDERSQHIISRQHPHFAGFIIAGRDQDQLFRMCHPDAHLEALVFLTENHLIIGDRRAKLVRHHLFRAPAFVYGSVKQVLTIFAEQETAIGARNAVRQFLTAFQIAKADREAF